MKAMTQKDYLWCALHLLLDDEESASLLCPACREEAEKDRCPVCGREKEETAQEENPAFDWARFQQLKEGTGHD